VSEVPSALWQGSRPMKDWTGITRHRRRSSRAASPQVLRNQAFAALLALKRQQGFLFSAAVPSPHAFFRTTHLTPGGFHPQTHMTQVHLRQPGGGTEGKNSGVRANGRRREGRNADSLESLI